MKIFDMLRNESEKSVNVLIAVALASGLSNSVLLIIINQAAENDAMGRDNTLLFIICICTVILYLLANWYVQRKSSEQIEGIIRKIRVRIINKIRHLLDSQTVKLLMQCLVISELDYCNALYVNKATTHPEL